MDQPLYVTRRLSLGQLAILVAIPSLAIEQGQLDVPADGAVQDLGLPARSGVVCSPAW